MGSALRLSESKIKQIEPFKMKNLGFAVVFLAIGLTLAEAKPQDGDRAPSTVVNCGCQCSNLIYKDENGLTHGNCRSTQWCFVDPDGSTCLDLQTGKVPDDLLPWFSNYLWSYEACATPACNYETIYDYKVNFAWII